MDKQQAALDSTRLSLNRSNSTSGIRGINGSEEKSTPVNLTNSAGGGGTYSKRSLSIAIPKDPRSVHKNPNFKTPNKEDCNRGRSPDENAANMDVTNASNSRKDSSAHGSALNTSV